MEAFKHDKILNKNWSNAIVSSFSRGGVRCFRSLKGIDAWMSNHCK